MHLLATVAHKGGTGKTTITAGLAGHWASEGRNVTVVDFDPQGGISAALGVPDGFTGPTIADVILRNRHPSQARLQVHDRIDIIPGSLELASAELDLPRRRGWQDLLRMRLESLDEMGAGTTDLVIVDSAPGLGVLPFMALRASDDCLVVCSRSYLAMRTLPYMLATADRANVHVVGIASSMVDNRTSHSQVAGEKMAADYGTQLLTAIPRRVALEDAALAGAPIQTYKPSSDVVAAFAQLAKEIEHGSIWHVDELD